MRTANEPGESTKAYVVLDPGSFEWRSAPFPKSTPMKSLNRIAKKLDEGVDVRNILSYCHEVARARFSSKR